MGWYPMGGPIFGASGKINLAYYDALKPMGKMCSSVDAKDTFSSRADHLKDSIISHLWNGDSGIMRMSDIVSATGICQDINAYSITTGNFFISFPISINSGCSKTFPATSFVSRDGKMGPKESDQSLRVRICN